MSGQCPLCNGLSSVTRDCTFCGGPLEDTGPLSEYLGPYSPYLEQQATDWCVHLLACPNCGYDEKISVHLISF